MNGKNKNALTKKNLYWALSLSSSVWSLCVCQSISQHVVFFSFTLFANLLSCAFGHYCYPNALWPLSNTFRFTVLPEKNPQQQQQQQQNSKNNNNQFSVSLLGLPLIIIITVVVVVVVVQCPMYSDRNVLLGILVLTAFRAVGCQYISHSLIFDLIVKILIDWQIGRFHSVYHYYCYYGGQTRTERCH